MRTQLSMITAAMLAGALTACAVAAPEPSPEATAPASPAATQTVNVDVYFAHAQPTRVTLISEPHTIDVDGDVVEGVLSAIVAGEVQPLDADYENLWGAGSSVLSTSRTADVLTVDLSVGTLTLGAEAESIALAQLVWTATSIDTSLTAVLFTIDGAGAETLAGHVDITGPIARDRAEVVLSPLQIVAPEEGSTATNPVVVVGMACTFEASFSWTLEGPGGVVDEGFGMASEGCPTRAPWQLDLGSLSAGDYLLIVFELSAEDGSVWATDSKNFTVAG